MDRFFHEYGWTVNDFLQAPWELVLTLSERIFQRKMMDYAYQLLIASSAFSGEAQKLWDKFLDLAGVKKKSKGSLKELEAMFREAGMPIQVERKRDGGRT